MITKEYLQQELAKRIDGYKRGVETTTDNIIAEMKSILVLVNGLEDNKYNDALKRAEVAYKDTDKHIKATIERIFPELHESEDERIRKQLISICDEWLGGGYSARPCLNDVKWLKNLLEKQKEQKPVDYDHEMWKNCEANFEGGKKEVIEHLEKYGLQKHAEWSKEDKTMLNNLIWAVHMKSISPLDEMDDRGNYERYEKFLTSLPGRFSLKPEREWSEEDENRFRNLIYLVEDSNEGKGTKEGFVKFINRLKSLHPSWKPSEEQMEALRYVAYEHGNSSLSPYSIANKTLASLYEQLKKL